MKHSRIAINTSGTNARQASMVTDKPFVFFCWLPDAVDGAQDIGG